MKKTKIKDRFENAFNAFCENERDETNALTVADSTTIITLEATKFSQKADKIYSIFKKVFLFFPGVLIIHLAATSYAIFYKEVGLNFWTVFWFAAGGFMIWAGIGDLKNIKHSLIPLSVILLGLLVGFSESVLPSSVIQFLFLLLPLFFIVPVLTKNALDKFASARSDLTE